LGVIGVRSTLAQEAALARGWHYERRIRENGPQSKSFDPSRQKRDIESAIRWHEAALRESTRIGDRQRQGWSEGNLKSLRNRLRDLENGKP
jgi:hypothetical protein